MRDSEKEEIKNLLKGLIHATAQWGLNNYSAQVTLQRGGADEHTPGLVYLQGYVAPANYVVVEDAVRTEPEFFRLSHIKASPNASSLSDLVNNPIDLVIREDDATLQGPMFSYGRRFSREAIKEDLLVGYASFPNDMFLKTCSGKPKYYRLIRSVFGIMVMVTSSGILILPTDDEYAYRPIYISKLINVRAWSILEEVDKKLRANLQDVTYKLSEDDQNNIDSIVTNWNEEQDDPFIDPDSQEDGIDQFLCGNEEELRTILTHTYNACHTLPDFKPDAEGSTLYIRMATEEESAYLDLDDYGSSTAAVCMTGNFPCVITAALEENTPQGWSWEYNDGARDRQSGYSLTASTLVFTLSPPSEHEILRSVNILRKWCRERAIPLPDLLQSTTKQNNKKN